MKNHIRSITSKFWGNRKIAATRLLVGATILASCSVIAANFNDAKENLSTSTCGLGEGIAMMPVDYSSTNNVAVAQSAQKSGSDELQADTFVAVPALSVEDRHWQMAEALKVALDRKTRTTSAE